MIGEKKYVIEDFIQIFEDDDGLTSKTEGIHLYIEGDETIKVNMKIDVTFPFRKSFAMRMKTRRKVILPPEDDDVLEVDDDLDIPGLGGGGASGNIIGGN